MMPEPAAPITCPQCRHTFDRFVTTQWGDGKQRQPIAPFLCSECGWIGLVNLVSSKVFDIGEAGWQYLQRKNPPLYDQVMTRRRQILHVIFQKGTLN